MSYVFSQIVLGLYCLIYSMLPRIDFLLLVWGGLNMGESLIVCDKILLISVINSNG